MTRVDKLARFSPFHPKPENAMTPEETKAAIAPALEAIAAAERTLEALAPPLRHRPELLRACARLSSLTHPIRVDGREVRA